MGSAGRYHSKNFATATDKDIKMHLSMAQKLDAKTKSASN